MTGLPQSVRDRLAAQQQATSAHPDADMLNAFIEDALSAGERSSVLDHLARCPTCREVVAVSGSLPEEVTVAPAPLPERQRFWNWGALRWAAPVVAVVVIGAAVLLRVRTGDVARPATTTRQEEVKQQSPPVEEHEAFRDAAPQVPASPANKKGSLAGGRTETKAKSDSRDYDYFAKQRESLPSKDERQNTPSTDQLAPMGGALASQSKVFVDKLEVPTKPAERRAQSPAPPPQARQELALGTAETVEVESTAPAIATETVADSKEADRRKSVVAKAAAPSPRRDGTYPAGNTSNYSMLNQTIPVPKVAVAWRVSQGRLMKTYDRIEWENVAFPDSAEITTYSAVGPQVWAGGKKGQLFHSINTGETWSRVQLGTQEDIRAIEFKDINFGTVTTASGVTWKTIDAGRTWSHD